MLERVYGYLSGCNRHDRILQSEHNVLHETQNYRWCGYLAVMVSNEILLLRYSQVDFVYLDYSPERQVFKLLLQFSKDIFSTGQFSKPNY